MLLPRRSILVLPIQRRGCSGEMFKTLIRESTGTFFLAQKLTAGGFISDWITALAGFPMAAGPSNYNFGTMPGCDILFSGTARPLVPGDILLANVTGATGNVSVSYEILVEPL